MNKFVRIFEFAKQLFAGCKVAEHAGRIATGITAARSPRQSAFSVHLTGNEVASYKRIQLFLHQVDPREALRMLFNEAADFVIADPPRSTVRMRTKPNMWGHSGMARRKGFGC